MCLGITSIYAADMSLPGNQAKASNSRGRLIPGWSEHVDPYRRKSMFWHKIWLDNNIPTNSLITDIMRRTRVQYHAQVRWVKRNSRFIQHQKMEHSVNNRNAKAKLRGKINQGP